MPSFLQYKRHLAVLDADDSNIEAWITVKGNHIPIMKGQSKEEAVKSFIEKKGQSTGAKPEPKSNKQVFYKNISGKQIGSPKGRTFIENEIMTEKEMAKRGFDPTDKRFERKELGKNEHHFFFGARFENQKERKQESKYDPEFETVRKNALANSSVYGGKYTQKSKSEAYKEYKNDTASKENMKKANKFVNSDYTKKPASIEETEQAVENFFAENYEKLQAKSLPKEHKYLKSQVADIEKQLKENHDKQKEAELKQKLESAKQELHDWEKSETMLGNGKYLIESGSGEKRELSKYAQVAKLIKQDLAKKGFKATAKSDSYSGGDSVHVRVSGWYSPEIQKKIGEEYSKYQQGHVNTYEDYYEYSNLNNDIPQTKYLFVDFDRPNDDDYKTAETYYKSHWHESDVAKYNEMADYEKRRHLDNMFMAGWTPDSVKRLSEVKKWAKENNLPFSYQDTMPEVKQTKKSTKMA